MVTPRVKLREQDPETRAHNFDEVSSRATHHFRRFAEESVRRKANAKAVACLA